jgi:3-oxoacyl-[acyl-carrier protein] reductase
VAFTYREAKGAAISLEQEITRSGGQAFAIQADSGDPEAVHAAVSETAGRFGGLEVLVNNAGTSHRAPIEDFPMAEYDRVLAVNVRGVFVAIQAAVPAPGRGRADHHHRQRAGRPGPDREYQRLRAHQGRGRRTVPQPRP